MSRISTWWLILSFLVSFFLLTFFSISAQLSLTFPCFDFVSLLILLLFIETISNVVLIFFMLMTTYWGPILTVVYSLHKMYFATNKNLFLPGESINRHIHTHYLLIKNTIQLYLIYGWACFESVAKFLFFFNLVLNYEEEFSSL